MAATHNHSRLQAFLRTVLVDEEFASSRAHRGWGAVIAETDEGARNDGRTTELGVACRQPGSAENSGSVWCQRRIHRRYGYGLRAKAKNFKGADAGGNRLCAYAR
ncbi:MAG: hypothetical protein ACLTDS_10210 [Bianqueaceae bacterium]